MCDVMGNEHTYTQSQNMVLPFTLTDTAERFPFVPIHKQFIRVSVGGGVGGLLKQHCRISFLQYITIELTHYRTFNHMIAVQLTCHLNNLSVCTPSVTWMKYYVECEKKFVKCLLLSVSHTNNTSTSVIQTQAAAKHISYSFKGQDHQHSTLWAVRVQFLVEGHFSVLMKTILQYPPGSRSQLTVLLCGWMCFEHQLDAEGGWFSSGIASWHTCPWIRLIDIEQVKALLFTDIVKDSQRKRETVILSTQRHVSNKNTLLSVLFSNHGFFGACRFLLKNTLMAMWHMLNTMYCHIYISMLVQEFTLATIQF